MTKFEQIGVNRQNDANSAREATKCFENSCRICNARGMQIECDHCAIRVTHEQTIAFFRDYEADDATKKFREMIHAFCGGVDMSLLGKV